MKLYFKEVAESILNIKPDKRNECFNWGADNAFPSLIEALVGMSVTAKNCSERVAKAIYGGSFGEAGKAIVNSKGQTLNEVLRVAARWYSKQNNCFLHIGYDANFEIKSISAIPVPDCRIGKSDDKGYSGKVIVYNNWDRSIRKQIRNSEFTAYDRYNPNKAVIEGQIRMSASEDGKTKNESPIEDIISQYNGQILHIKKDDVYIYALPELSPVLSEALLESNSQIFRSRGAQKGFLNTKLMTVAPFKDKEARKEFKKDLNDLRGAEGSNDVLLLETAQNSDDVKKQFSVDDLSGAYNDKLFEYSDKQAERNICKAYTVPLMLVSQTDNSLFGSSGEMLREAKVQLWENREEERSQFEEVFNDLKSNFQKEEMSEGRLEILNPYQVKTEEKAEE